MYIVKFIVPDLADIFDTRQPYAGVYFIPPVRDYEFGYYGDMKAKRLAPLCKDREEGEASSRPSKYNSKISVFVLKVPKCEILMSWIFMIFLS
jgi:hypothetical protein